MARSIMHKALFLLILSASAIFPNSFTKGNALYFTVNSEEQLVEIGVYNIHGIKLHTTYKATLPLGGYKINPINNTMYDIPNGIYFISLAIGHEKTQHLMVNNGTLPDGIGLEKVKIDPQSELDAPKPSETYTNSMIVKDFASKDPLSKVQRNILTYNENCLSNIFEVNIPQSGFFYISTWIRGCYKAKQYSISINGKNVGILETNSDEWQNSFVKQHNTDDDPCSFPLNKGLNQIAINSTGAFFPNIELLKTEKTIEAAQIFCTQPKPRPKTATSVTYLAPEADYVFEEGLSFSYTYKQFCYLIQNTLYQIMTFDNDTPEDDPVLYLFNYSNPDDGTWADDNSGPDSQAYVYCLPSVTGIYMLVIRAANSNNPGDVGLYSPQLGTLSATLAAAGEKLDCSDISEEDSLNFFTCKSSGDTRIWVMDDYNASYGKVRRYNDDYSEPPFAQWEWGTDSRIRDDISQDISYMLVSAFSTGTTGECDAYMKADTCSDAIFSAFLNLEYDDGIKSADRTSSYNCISWSGGRVDLGSGFWPPDDLNPWYDTSGALASFDNFYANIDADGYALCRGRDTDTSTEYKAQDFTRSGADSNNAVVALWKDYNYTHASVANYGNEHMHGKDWESKPGQLQRIFHNRDGLVSPSYGTIYCYYRWDGTYTTGTPPAKVASIPSSFNGELEIVKFTENELLKLDTLALNTENGIVSNFNMKYNTWKATWSRPELQIHSNPQMYAQSIEYRDLISFCRQKPVEVLPLLINRHAKGDEWVMNAIRDLTIDSHKLLRRQIVLNGNNKARSDGKVPSQTANWTTYSKYLLEAY